MKQIYRVYLGVVFQWLFIGLLIALFIWDETGMLIRPAIIILFVFVFNTHRKVRLLATKQDFANVDMTYRLSNLDKKKKGKK